MILTIISISLWIIIPLFYVIFNLYNKNKKMESIISNQRNFVKDFLQMSKSFSEITNKIEMTMWVNSDPELQELFEKIKQIKELLDSYEEK
jgi:predicted RND superfamily exporter protein